MCIYCGTTRYRKIYEEHCGPIPKDEEGRIYDVHHLDGNRKNNNPTNLVALSRKKHYDIHYQQNDYRACQLLAVRMKLSPKKIAELARNAALKLLKENRHNFQKQINPFATRPDNTNMAQDRTNAGLNSGLNHPYANKTIHTFKHKKLGIIENMTAYELQMKHNVNRSNVSQMVRGKRKSVAGWQLI